MKSYFFKKNIILFIFIILLICSYIVVFYNNNKISYNLLSVFPLNNPEVNRIGAFEKFNISNVIIFELTLQNKNSDDLIIFKQKLKNIKGIKLVILDYNDIPINNILNFLNETYFVRNKLHIPKNVNNKWVSNRLKKLKTIITISPFMLNSIDIQKDPLMIFNNKNFNFNLSSFSQFNDNKIIENRKKLIYATTDIPLTDLQSSTALYNNINNIIKEFSKNLNIKYFMPHMYSVENSKMLNKIVTALLAVIFITMFFFYLIFVKNIKLIIITYCNISLAIIISFLITTLFFNKITILTLAFSGTVLDISVDYAIHNYVRGHFHSKRFVIDRDVFISYISLLICFILLTLTEFQLLKQIGFLCAFGLTFSLIGITYLTPLFGDFNYPHIETTFYDSKLNNKIFYILLPLSLIFTYLPLSKMDIDYKLRNLDYQNKKLLSLENYFKKNINSKKLCIIEGNSIEQLLENCERTKKIFNTNKINALFITDIVPSIRTQLSNINKIKNTDWDSLKKLMITEGMKLGFNKDFLKNAYNFKNIKLITLPQFFSDYGLQIVKHNGKYYTIGLTDKNIKNLKNVFFIESNNLLKHTVQKILVQFLYVILITLAILFLVLLTYYKKISNVIICMTFIFLPLAITLIIMYVFKIKLNILHIFSFLLIIFLNLDYGIYYNIHEKFNHVRKAMFISMITTLINFTPFIFTNVGALFSIGIPIIISTLVVMAIAFINETKFFKFFSKTHL